MRILVAVALFGAGSLILGSAPADACCMLPRGHAATIGQAGQKAVLVHHAGKEDLILAVDYRISGETMPDRFAWVITVPAEPHAYAVVEEEIFREVADWAIPLVTPKPEESWGLKRGAGGLDAPVAPAADLEFGKRTVVGPYDIQPVRARGLHALESLNDWLTENGFPTEDPGHMAYFVREEFTFLAVRVTPPEEGQPVAKGGLLPPLHLSFDSERPYYPLRFSSRMGPLDIDIFALTGEAFDYEASKSTLDRIRWEDVGLLRNVEVIADRLPTRLGKALSKSPLGARKEGWYLNVLRPRRVNADDTIRTWEEDVFFTTGPVPMNRAWLVAVAAALLAGGFLFVRARGKRVAAH